MPSKNKTKKQNQSAPPQPSRRKRRNKNKQPALSGLAKMLDDPCGSSLVPGLYGETEGYLTKFHRTQAVTLGGSGYIVWFPDMMGDATDQYPNLSCWISATAADRPINTSAIPYGTAADEYDQASNTASTILEPHQTFLSGQASSYRTLSACLEIKYIGRMDATQGEVAVLTGVPLTAVAPSTAVFPTADEMFALAEGSQRLSLHPHTVKFRPSDTSHTFKRAGSGAFSSALHSNLGSFATTATNVANSLQPEAIVIAWRSCGPAFLASVSQTIGVEWTPKFSEGLVNPSPVSVGSPSTYSSVTKMLDSIKRGWDRVDESTRNRAVDFLIQTAQSGYSAYSANPRQRRLM